MEPVCAGVEPVCAGVEPVCAGVEPVCDGPSPSLGTVTAVGTEVGGALSGPLWVVFSEGASGVTV